MPSYLLLLLPPPPSMQTLARIFHAGAYKLAPHESSGLAEREFLRLLLPTALVYQLKCWI